MKLTELHEDLLRAVAITEKDMKVYYLKPPSIFFGIMLPLTLYFAFTVGRPCVTEAYRLTGVVAISAFFGASTLEAVVIPLERKSGTFDRLVAAPVSLRTLVLAKIASGTIFGLLSALAVAVILILLGPGWQWVGLIPSGLSIEPTLFLLAIIVSAVNFSSLGILISARAGDVPDAMMPMNFIRFLMIFLSGVFISIEETFAFMPSLQPLAYIFPLTYAVDALRQTTYGPAQPQMLFIDFAALLASSATFIVATTELIRRALR